MSDNKIKEHISKLSDQDALDFHSQGKAGKIAVIPTKPLTTQRDLSLAYSPGVAVPCLEIEKNPDAAYDYTAKGNFVAVITNGTAVLGLGNLGALAAKPVMEGKSVLFKRFADIDSIDVEIDSTDTKEIINTVKNIAASWGGINLEDIKSPECFIIEKELKKICDVPVFHDDQHGTAIIAAAGLINAVRIGKKKFEDLIVVVNGSGSAGIACLELIQELGVKKENSYLCDRKGIIHTERNDSSMNEWKRKHSIKTKKRTLTEAMDGADVFLGLSVAGALKKEMVKNMAKDPIIFAMANPTPEIMPEEARQVRPDAIIATGRSDYQNQVNNVLGFPYIFRGALDVRATAINEEMKLAAAYALAELARKPVPAEVSSAYSGQKMSFGPNYIIPVPFDPRLIHTIPIAVAKAAIKSGVARKEITDWTKYERELAGRLNPVANSLNLIFGKLRNNPTNVLFAEGEHSNVLNAAKLWQGSSYGKAVILTKTNRLKELEEQMTKLSITKDDITIIDISNDAKTDLYAKKLYKKLQRQGYSERECYKMVTHDRNIYAACAVDIGDTELVVTGVTKNYIEVIQDIEKVISEKNDEKLFGYSVIATKDRTIFVADTLVNEFPTAQEIADTAVAMAKEVKKFNQTPRVALVSFSNFGSRLNEHSSRMKEAKEILDGMNVDFEYDGDMFPDIALNEDLLKLYPFANLTKAANILIMPGLHSSVISTKIIKEIGGASVVGPILAGLEKPVQICSIGSSTENIINLAAISSLKIKEDV